MKQKLLHCPNCLNPFVVKKIPKGFIEAETKCPKCELTILRRANPHWHFTKENDYFIGVYNSNTVSLDDYDIPYNSKHIDDLSAKQILSLLSPDEVEIALLLKDGYKQREIAKRIQQPEHYVWNRLKNIRTKLLNFK